MKNATYLFVLSLCIVSSVFGSDVLYKTDFSKQKNGDAKVWLKRQGFQLLLDADKLSMQFKDGRLYIQTSKNLAGMFGMQFSSDKFINNVGSVKIVWGG